MREDVLGALKTNSRVYTQWGWLGFCILKVFCCSLVFIVRKGIIYQENILRESVVFTLEAYQVKNLVLLPWWRYSTALWSGQFREVTHRVGSRNQTLFSVASVMSLVRHNHSKSWAWQNQVAFVLHTLLLWKSSQIWQQAHTTARRELSSLVCVGTGNFGVFYAGTMDPGQDLSLNRWNIVTDKGIQEEKWLRWHRNCGGFE